MSVLEELERLDFEPLDYDPRYYVHTAKNSITSFVQIIGGETPAGACRGT